MFSHMTPVTDELTSCPNVVRNDRLVAFIIWVSAVYISCAF